MKKFTLTVMMATMLSLFYVHQKVEIYNMGYDLQKSRKYLSYLVDQNSKLMYELSKMESPRYLLASLDKNDMEFSGREARKDNEYYLSRDINYDENVSDGVLGKVFDIFTVSAEARPKK